jgi:uracil-DNA glycosylase family 4
MEGELAILHQEVQCCRRCSGLRPWRKFKTDTHGNPAARFMIVGEAPGEKSLGAGGPWRGQAGQRLRKVLKQLGWKLEEVAYLTDAVKCGPPGNRQPVPAECANCAHFLAQEIALVKPKRIVTFGGLAFSLLAGSLFRESAEAKWGPVAPRVTEIHNDDGYCVLEGAQAALIPLLHPSRANMYMDYDLYSRHLREVFSGR